MGLGARDRKNVAAIDKKVTAIDKNETAIDNTCSRD
jgi:hypothetical protein